MDMLRFYAATVLVCAGNLNQAVNQLATMAFMANDPDVPPLMKELHKYLVELQTEAVKLPLSMSLREQFKRVIETVNASGSSQLEAQIAITLCQELQKNLVHELAGHLFFSVPSSRKWIYLEPDKWFGLAAAKSFPDAARDIRDACQCYALAQWTATVFHGMRILEHGLRALASSLGVTFASGIELENWKNILDQIDKEIRRVDQLPKSQQKSEDLQFYSEAAAQFRYFKDAWRNHVSHSRAAYDEQGARQVLDHVKGGCPVAC